MVSWKDCLAKRIILDNGSDSIRAGTVQSSSALTAPNLLALDRKTGVIQDIDVQSTLYDELHTTYLNPHVRGVLVDWDHQVQIWESLFSKNLFQDPQNSAICYSYHPGNPRKVQVRSGEIFLEYFGFDAFYPALNQQMIRLTQAPKYTSFSIVVESSHSATYIVPFFDGEPIQPAITRLDVGGKLLQNQLRELISF